MTHTLPPNSGCRFSQNQLKFAVRTAEENMTSNKLLTAGAALISFFAIAMSQGDAKHFTKDGLVFDYANGWTIADESNTDAKQFTLNPSGSDSDAQQFTLNRSGSDAQIRIFAHRGKVDSPEKFAQAKKAFIDPYVKSVRH